MRQSPEGLTSLLPQVHAQVFDTPPSVSRPQGVDIEPPLASSAEAGDRSVSLSQDELEGHELQQERERQENEEMMMVLRESKRSAALEEEARRRTWTELGCTPPPGPSGVTEKSSQAQESKSAQNAKSQAAGKEPSVEEVKEAGPEDPVKRTSER